MFKQVDHSHAMKKKPSVINPRKWLDVTWWSCLIALLICISLIIKTRYFCTYTATDFRGYYASAQIAWQRGFSWVYHQPTQDAYQANLLLSCPDGSLQPPPIRVTMPYFPVFVVLFMPFIVFDFSVSFILWTLLNLIILVCYCWYFCSSLVERVDSLKLFQWLLCLPLLASFALGQMNVFLVVCLGEFTLSMIRGMKIRSGFWLAGMLLKPHTLILFLPGLLLSRRWKQMIGFLVSFGVISIISYLLAGVQGLRGMLQMIGQFADSSFQTAPTMMNWRSLALNLSGLIPIEMAWAIALSGMIIVAGYSLSIWRTHFRIDKPSGINELDNYAFKTQSSATRTALVILITYSGTCSIAWHSHFYMLMPMIPFLLFLDCQNRIPVSFLALWVWGPPLIYLLCSWISPGLARNGLGLFMLGINLVLFVWVRSTLFKKRLQIA